MGVKAFTGRWITRAAGCGPALIQGSLYGKKKGVENMEPSVEKLVKQAQRGDKDAFLRLMEGQKRAMTRVAMSILRNEEDAADAISETVITAFEKLCTLREPRYFKTWLTRVLIRHSCDILRDRGRAAPLESLREEGMEESREESLDVRESLNALGENDRLILTLRYLDDFSVRQIAEILSVKENTVKTRLLRGRERFRKIYLEREAECCEALGK